ncbi:hypothetical protein CHUAL_006808 [Chamberlinius hualienensis]
MAPPLIPLIVIAVISLYMAVSYICHYNLFEPRLARGRVVLLTDATSKIGNQIAVVFSSMNTKLFIVGRDISELERVKSECYKHGAQQVYLLNGDFLSKNFREKVIEDVIRRYGKLDFLILLPDGHLEANIAPWNDGGNLTSVTDSYIIPNIHMAGLALPFLKQTRGYVGSVSTMPGKVSLPYLASVSASKAALQAYFTSLRQELKRPRDSYVSVTSVTIAYMNGVNGEKEEGRWGPIFRKYGSVSIEDAVEHAVYAIGGRKKEVTFPFAAQCHSIFYRWFPSFYENPEMPSLNSLISSLSIAK